ncbi:omega-amidase, chloroplastic [Selaginella moellendorffii]|uniref:omega-amidase, chloroplastic n=1 Tax=Selaginella moellendorffii TaxID=88036 RepID=UPI000D1CC461|nr:omega-amidase, chloroplastic [Selaginella moellendorffii]|eukprot:XP_024532120.1 omega-amidase, chloroplastic [Selaginella moellendorffii]
MFLWQFMLAVCQLSICVDKEQNIRHAREAIQTLADGGSKLILLPVKFCSCLFSHKENVLQEMGNFPDSNASFPIYAGDSPSSKILSDMAKSKEVTIICGSIPERRGNHLYNTCCIYGKDGSLKGKIQKYTVVDSGKILQALRQAK